MTGSAGVECVAVGEAVESVRAMWPETGSAGVDSVVAGEAVKGGAAWPGSVVPVVGPVKDVGTVWPGTGRAGVENLAGGAVKRAGVNCVVAVTGPVEGVNRKRRCGESCGQRGGGRRSRMARDRKSRCTLCRHGER